MQAAKQAVLDMAKQSFDEQLFAGTSGNLSIYDPETGLMTITPSSVPYPGMTIDDIVVCDLDGNIKEAKPGRVPSSEWRLHAAIYKNKPNFTAVVHTHSPYATAYATLHKEVPVILVEMVPFLGGSLRVAEFANAGTPAVGENAVKALENRTVCLLANHGVVAAGPNLDRAHISAVYAEDAAKICMLAQGIGQPVEVPMDIQNAVRARCGFAPE